MKALAHKGTGPQLRPVPLILGMFFAAVTARVLFDDVIHGAEISTSHLLSLAALVAALASGHMAWPTLKSGSVVHGLMLLILFVGSTAFVVVSSGARNAETAASKATAAIETNRARDRETKMLERAETMLTETADRLQADCVVGRKSKGHCDGLRTTLAVYQAAVKGHKATLAELGPERVASGYAHAAKVLAAVPGVTAEAGDIQARLELLLPFLVVLIAELGTIVFLHLGIGQRLPVTVDAAANVAANVPAPSGPVPPRGGRKASAPAANVISLAGKRAALAALQRAGGPVSNRELARLMGVSDGEASKRVRELGGLVNVQRHGRCVLVSIAGQAAAA